jgi:hypothetical protein
MRARPTRTVSVGTTPVNIRKTAAFANDPDAYPVTYSVIRYPSGGGTIEMVPLSTSVFGDGQTVDAGADFNDPDQSVVRYAVASAGTISVDVTDYEA